MSTKLPNNISRQDGHPAHVGAEVAVDSYGNSFSDANFAAFSFNGVGNEERWALIADLSDTTNFPHDPGEAFVVYATYFSIRKSKLASGVVQVGVVTKIDGSNVNVAMFAGEGFTESDDENFRRDRTVAPLLWNLQIENDSAKRIVSGFNLADQQIAVLLDTPINGFQAVPEVGDIVARVSGDGTKLFDTSVSLFYNTIEIPPA